MVGVGVWWEGRVAGEACMGGGMCGGGGMLGRGGGMRGRGGGMHGRGEGACVVGGVHGMGLAWQE